MSESEIEKLEKKVKSLIIISTQLKESNDHLLASTKKLKTENIIINARLSKAKVKVKKIIEEIKDQN